MKKNFGFFVFVALLAGAAFALGLFACSNGSDGTPMIVLPGENNATDDGNTNSGGTNTPTPTPATTYTITFNANDGSPSPFTATQTFTAGTPQNLKTIAELGFSKSGFYFAGWGTSADATESVYVDGTEYTADADTTFYALWSEVPVYSVKIFNYPNNCGTASASSSTGIAGAEITLSNMPAIGYQFASYNVLDADGETVAVTDGKFIMPAKNVTVTATFLAIHYNINVESFANGSVTANPTTATVGTSVTLTICPASGCQFATLVVTDSDGTSVAVSGTGDSRTFTMPAKNVTVAFKFYATMTLGSWPQTIKAANVTVSGQSESKTVGEFTYYKGNDGEWYAKIKESCFGYSCDYKYSDGTTVAQSSADSYKWFKVEPIKWRVLTTDYNGTGKKLLHAENILIGKRYDARKNNYQNSEIRKWLNSNANSAAASDCSGSGGFLKTAFTSEELAIIANTSVDNGVRSTLPDNYDSLEDRYQRGWNGGKNEYASDTPTTDKVFLLSVQEVTNNDYGFDVYYAHKGDNKHDDSTRIRVTTDYAKASGASGPIHDPGGSWWLRSPLYRSGDDVSFVYNWGDVVCGNSNSNISTGVFSCTYGVAPALCVDN